MTSPAELGLNPKFAEFHPDQWEAIEEVYNSTLWGGPRFTLLGLPTGAGKSLIPPAVCNLLDYRGVVLTATKGLQDQYLSDHGKQGLVIIKGKNNYQCQDNKSLNCDEGMKAKCRSAESCPYQQALFEARNRKLVVPNYNYWLAASKSRGMLETESGKPSKPFQILFLDEAHLAPKILSDYLQIRTSQRDFKKLIEDKVIDSKPPNTDSVLEWQLWSLQYKTAVANYLENLQTQIKIADSKPSLDDIKNIKHIEVISDKLDRLSRMDEGDWIADHADSSYGRNYLFDPLWPGKVSELHLFQNIPKIVMMSATLRPDTAAKLGISREKYSFREWPRRFPSNRCPVFAVVRKPEIKMGRFTSEFDMARWINLIDEIADTWKGYKGIIHTVSYNLQCYILEHSRHSKSMIANTDSADSENAQQVYNRFLKSKPPSILVSPSFGTGWNFPDDTARWQIIGKIPFPDISTKIMQARSQKDKQYSTGIAMQELVQQSGRINRSYDDWGYTYIIDGNIGWFMHAGRPSAPGWFEVRKQADITGPAKHLLQL